MRVGIFDSGIGGLTVFREIARRFPSLDIIYLGDTARVPYGTKSPETVVRYSFEAAHFLGRHGIDVLVVACNTSSALALEALQKDLPIPAIGVIRPGAIRAVQVTRNGRIGVIGTPATIRSGAYPREIHAAAENSPPWKPTGQETVRGGQELMAERRRPEVRSPDGLDGPSHDSAVRIEVISRACPLFVPLAEEGWTDNAVALETARVYLEPYRDESVDTLVLGCTHYPILRNVIAKVMGPDVALVDSAEPVAEEIASRIAEAGVQGPATGLADSRGTDGRASSRVPSGLDRSAGAASHAAERTKQSSHDTERTGERRLFVTDNRERFCEVGARFLEEPIEGVEQVSIVGD